MATPAYYEFFQQRLGPSWLQGPNGQAWLGGFGAEKDTALAAIKRAVKDRMALAAEALSDSSALDAIGWERSLPRLSGEADSAYAARLAAGWAVWPYAGTARGLLEALAASGYANVALAQRNGVLWTLSGGAAEGTEIPAWAFDANPESLVWNRFMLIFFSPFPSTWSPYPPPSEQSLIAALVEKWKSAAAVSFGAVQLQSGELWGYPVGDWGGGTWGGTSFTWMT